MLSRDKKNISGVMVAAILILVMIIGIGFLGTNLWSSYQRAHAAAPVPRTISKVQDFAMPGGFDPWGIAVDSSARVWVAIPDCDPTPQCGGTNPGELAAFRTGDSSWVFHYNLPAGYGQPFFLAFASDGTLWFAMPMSNSIGSFNPKTHVFSQWTVPTANSGPWDIAVDHNGKIWFTEHYTNKVGEFDPTTHTFVKEFATPAANSQPYGIVVDGANNVWFTENNASVALIGEITAQGQLQEYKIRNGSTANLTPHLIIVDTNGNIWWSEGWVGALGELRVASAQPGTNNGVSEYFYKPPCSNCGTHTSGISVDSKGNIWFDDSLQSVYGTFPESGTGQFTFFNTPTSGSHPHDGLRVDSKNRVWISEEFANKLIRVIQAS